MTNRLSSSLPIKLKILTLGILTMAATACSAPEATIQLGGSLSVFPVGASFDVDDLPDDWFTSGDISEDRVGGSSKLGTSTISVTSAPFPYLMARRVSANILATPYLSWQWRFELGKWTYHPIRVVVGFSGGGGETVVPGFFSRLFPGSSVPRHDRVLSLVWAPSALMRGSLVPIATNKAQVHEARYTVRGGAENIGKWWPETVDLASLYKESWPMDEMGNVRITFIGVSSASSDQKLTAYLSDLRLSR